MIYPDNFEEKIKFAAVRRLVAGHCLSRPGAEMAEAMTFGTRPDEVRTALTLTDEFRRILESDEAFPSQGFDDLREALRRIRIEGLYLEEAELSALARAMRSMGEVVRFFGAQADKYPTLARRAEPVAVFPVLTERIESILDKYGNIRDSASPDLAAIRRDILAKQSAVSKRLASILRQAQAEGIVEADATVSIREGRAVIPVPAANKRKISGIVLDESATGRTSFIEPAEVVTINNELRELSYAERREIIRILTAMSDNIRPYIDDILGSYEFLAFVDFVRAKARFALDTESTLPQIDTDGDHYMFWQNARHPLLFLQLRAQGKSIVPLDIELSRPLQRILLISGPNAGGKSVCLQTVGLVQYMMQCGMLVPMAEGSRMTLFDNIFIDMGDEQSIENDLSTYSSHLTNMKYFVRHSDSSTLLLIDEFGTGTEPALGGAIAESVLAELNRREAFGVVTTHYTNLKHFAAQTEGIHNGAMLFDTHAIRPLFRLQMGQPGSSFAFEIARKIGLPESILADAANKLGHDHLDFDKHLREIVRDKRYWEMKRQSVKDADKRLTETLERYQTELQNIKRERREILDRAKQEAERMLAEANKRIELTIKEIREKQAAREHTRQVREDLDLFRRAVEDTKADDEAIERKMQRIVERRERKQKRNADKAAAASAAPAASPKPDDTPIAVGDTVSIDGQAGATGEVVELFGREATVAVGNLQTRIRLTRLRKISSRAARRERKDPVVVIASNVSEAVREKKLNFKAEIDVRGMRTDEAIEKVASFVDEAIICEQTQLRILHGKGNGILRQMIRQYLHTLPFVADVEDEHVQFGGAGISIVTLR